MKRKSHAWLIGCSIVGSITIVILLLLTSSSYTVNQFERAVIFKKFGGGLDKENVIGAGTWYKPAWDEVYIYNVGESLLEESLDALDKDGNLIHAEIAVRFTLVPDKIGFLHESFGPGYKEAFVIPEARSATRQVLGRYSAEEIYSSKRSEVEIAINHEAGIVLQRNFVQL